MFKVGLIGCGKISHGHVAAFNEVPDAQITAACDLVEENLNYVCENTGAKGYFDYKEMIEKEDLDLAVITLPHSLHCEATCFCAEKGLDIFLEKPMGISSDDCQEMIDCCKKNNVMLWVGNIQSYMPINIEAKKLIDSGELGELVSITETRNVNYFAPNRPAWFLKKAISGGGIMINLGSHSLDKIKFFTGSEVEDISGSIHMREGYDCEDSAQAFVKMKNGVCATLNLIGHIPASTYSTVLYLTKGEIRVGQGGTVSYCKEDGVFTNIECEKTPGMKLQIFDVVRVLREGTKKPVIDGEYGKDIIHAVKKLYGEEK